MWCNARWLLRATVLPLQREGDDMYKVCFLLLSSSLLVAACNDVSVRIMGDGLARNVYS